ncbi:MAG: hypothetical protein NTW28_00980 [Candidatus Solibacter sp.]|nr:hypothetical protein [Candidatus Solibacter sp.]
MRRGILAFTLLFALGLIRVSAQHPQLRHFLLNRDILALASAGFDEQTIVNTILAKPSRFDTAADALASLAAQGLSQRIVQAMLVAKACGSPADLGGGRPAPCRPEPEARRPQTGASGSRQLPRAAMGEDYRTPIDIHLDRRCLLGDVSLSLAGGALPKGLQLTMSGLAGVPREMGLFHFVVLARNVCTAVPVSLQLLVTGKPILEAAPDEIAFSCPSPAQSPAPRTILVSSTWPNLTYAVEKRNADWLRVTQARGVTPGLDSAITGDVVTLSVDPSKLKPGVYRGSVHFSTWDGANSPDVPVVLVVGSQL